MLFSHYLPLSFQFSHYLPLSFQFSHYLPLSFQFSHYLPKLSVFSLLPLSCAVFSLFTFTFPVFSLLPLSCHAVFSLLPLSCRAVFSLFTFKLSVFSLLPLSCRAVSSLAPDSPLVCPEPLAPPPFRQATPALLIGSRCSGRPMGARLPAAVGARHSTDRRCQPAPGYCPADSLSHLSAHWLFHAASCYTC